VCVTNAVENNFCPPTQVKH